MTPSKIHASLRPSDCKSFAQPRAAGTVPIVDKRQMNDRLNRCERIEENRSGKRREDRSPKRRWMESKKVRALVHILRNISGSVFAHVIAGLI